MGVADLKPSYLKTRFRSKPTLAEADIERTLPHRARSLAAILEKEFKGYVAAVSATMWQPRKQQRYQPEPVDP
jgi:hypothetical protein